MTTSAEYAGKYLQSGLNVIPIRPDGSKAPLVSEWKRYQENAVAIVDVDAMFSPGCGLAAICGRVSGNLEVIDFDDAATFAAWSDAVDATCGPELLPRLVIVQTPRPGFHVYLRAAEIAGSQKLAMSGTRQAAKVLIETKGEGGYVLLPGSPAECHETRNLYKCIQGRFSDIPTLTAEERESLLSCARSFNELRREESPRPANRMESGADAPGTDFNQRADWSDLLRAQGYKFSYARGEESFWTRPGKGAGVSASTNYAGSGLFYPFSTNCYPFEADKSYSKFAFHAVTEHGGDFHAAARSLLREGYGTPTERQAPERKSEPVAADIVEADSLRARVMALYSTGLPPGVSPGLECLRQLWTLRPGDWTLVTGIPSHGKSALMDNVMMNTAIQQGWKWAVWSAENLPQELHIANLISLHSGRPFSDGYHQRVSVAELNQAMDFIEEHFCFIAPPEEDETIERLLADVSMLLQSGPINGLLVDPWNELTHSYQDSETEYISRSLKRVGRFAKANKVHAIIVAHPQKLRKNNDGSYPIPTPYDVSGSAHWRNKADCALCVWRDEQRPGTATVYVQKVRRKFVGRIGSADLAYDIVSGIYSDPIQGRQGWQESQGDWE